MSHLGQGSSYISQKVTSTRYDMQDPQDSLMESSL